MAMYFVQIVNQPHQILVLKALHTQLVLPPIKHVAELIVELGRGSVEAIELLQDRRIGWGHRGTLRRRSEWEKIDGLLVVDGRVYVPSASPDP